MLGKTHMAVGIAATLACTCPKTVAELSMAVAIGTVGALIPDIDVESSESCRKANGAILLLSAISAAAAALDYFMGIKILEDVAGNSDAARIFAGVLLFVGTCVFGKKQPHRSLCIPSWRWRCWTGRSPLHFLCSFPILRLVSSPIWFWIFATKRDLSYSIPANTASAWGGSAPTAGLTACYVPQDVPQRCCCL